MLNNKQKVKTNKAVVWMIKLIKPYKYWLYIHLVALIILTVINLVKVYFIKNLVDNTLDSQYENMIDIIVYLVLVLVMGIVISYLSTYSSGRFSHFVTLNTKQKIIEHITNMHMEDFDKQSIGEYVSVLSNEVGIVSRFVGQTLPSILFQGCMLVTASIYMIAVNWKLYLASSFLIPFTLIILNRLSQEVKNYSKNRLEFIGQGNTVIHDTLRGMDTVKAYNLQNKRLSTLKYLLNNAYNMEKKLEKIRAVSLPILFLQTRFTHILCLLVGGYMVAQNTIKPGDLIAFIQLIGFIITPVVFFPHLLIDIKHASAALKKIGDFLDYDTERVDGNDYPYIKNPVIAFDHVCFSYNQSTDVLDKITFHINKGEIVAFVGDSGSGKSTIIKLLCGFYHTYRGTIKLNGEEMSKWNLNSWRHQIALVSQDIYLFPGTIAENIAYGCVGATMEEIMFAAKQANAHDFIIKKPEGYGTKVGEMGMKISGGERQRISIARAILKKTPILLLDESTSALDMESEAMINRSLFESKQCPTIITVTHRLTMVKQANHIYVLSKGCIVDKGTHDTLMETCDKYKKLYLKQQVDKNIKGEYDD
ncbi:ABC transporter ATP-binding protein [Vallitalea pronyensis]|uniref:ABC transporter ATP-binding protein n=1 Tax=Vallitalea pronyensis TaxID=1348613 RepID=A0A8J8SF45_9FIRM|nr:ABC transporter ATP-binding protein [Vallitalea pronyensis]QUI20879.1 ABC transporter ATP-binding protein [Vallitalea pronyensis]